MLFILNLYYIVNIICFIYSKSLEINKFKFIKGNTRKDKYGLDLNINILDGIYSINFNEGCNENIEEWTLYTPPCPYLRPIHYSQEFLNPNCEDSSLQLVNYDLNQNNALPHIIRLYSISNQIKKWLKWKKDINDYSIYENKTINDMIENKYYPFDYGFYNLKTKNIDDNEYYKNIINSRMDEVPDPRKRRLFSFILFNGEFDLLDVYLSEYYEIIDYFVIFESNTTFSGLPKPLYFTRTLLETKRYENFKDKLIPLPYVLSVDEDNGRGKGFPKEHIARRIVIEKGLRSVHARHGDLFIHSDLDEMPKSHILTRLKKCGGWEHLQAGIGGGPKSFKNGNVESYFINKNLNITTTTYGEYDIKYDKESSLGLLSWFHEYSFNIVENKSKGTVAHPNIAIFDARRSLGQLIKYDYININNITKIEDPLTNKNLDPYQGYTYSDNTNDKRRGKGYLGEKHLRFDTSIIGALEKNKRPLIWNGGWHLSSFLPTIDQLYNKIISYSHYNYFKFNSIDEIKENLIERIKNNKYIYGNKKYDENIPVFPSSYKNGYSYNFSYKYWNKMINGNETNENFKNYLNILNHEIPTQIWKNPICYAFMIDRSFGLNKKLWWEMIPKSEWNNIKFEELNNNILNKIIPNGLTNLFKEQMFNDMKEENNKPKISDEL